MAPWQRVRQLLEMIRFSHTIFALPFALLAAVMAWTADSGSTGFRAVHLVGILLCMVTARSAAMAFNRIVDRHIDAQNPRTAQRHLPTRQIAVSTAVVFTVLCSAAFVASTLLFLPNRLPLLLSVPVLAFLLLYSYAKRWTALAHVWLGAALMLAPVCAWIAIRGEVVLANGLDLLPAAALGLAVLFWVTGFDVIYACQDFDFDQSRGLHSIPARWGVATALRAAAAFHLLTLLCLASLPWVQQLGGPELDWGWPFAVCLGAVAALLIYEHALVRPENLSRVNTAFFHVNAVISVALLAAGTVDLLWL